MNKLIALCLLALPLAAADRKPKPDAVISIEAASEAPTFRLTNKQTAHINTKIRYDTLIRLPDSEQVKEVGAGDVGKENGEGGAWIIRYKNNIVHVKPARINAATNMHVLGASGHTYSFDLREVSSCRGCQPDLKVFVEPMDEAPDPAIQERVDQEKRSVAKIAELNAQVDTLRVAAKQAKVEAAAEIARATDEFRAGYPLQLRCDYQYRANKAPFLVTSICSDSRFTWIKAGAREMPSLYTYRDGKPALIQFQYYRGATATEGTYKIDNVITSGYLAIGKRKKLKFHTRASDEK
jgi:type IV secretory pathway VirB9-like protein